MGIAAVIISGIMLKKTRMFCRRSGPFVMELPHITGRQQEMYYVPCGSGQVHLSKKQEQLFFFHLFLYGQVLRFGFVDGAFVFDPGYGA